MLRRAEAETATQRQRAAEEDIRERLRAKGLRRVAGDDFTVVWSPVRGRPSYDMKSIREAAAKAGLDLAEYETVGDPTDRLVIRVIGPPCSAALICKLNGDDYEQLRKTKADRADQRRHGRLLS
jgi:hypothetical protein